MSATAFFSTLLVLFFFDLVGPAKICRTPAPLIHLRLPTLPAQSLPLALASLRQAEDVSTCIRLLLHISAADSVPSEDPHASASRK